MRIPRFYVNFKFNQFVIILLN